jgi:hypothetical protein
MLLMENKRSTPIFVTIDYVADYLGLDSNVVWNMVVKEKKIKYIRTGSGKRGSIRVYYDDFMRYIAENTVDPNPQTEQEKEEEK